LAFPADKGAFPRPVISIACHPATSSSKLTGHPVAAMFLCTKNRKQTPNNLALRLAEWKTQLLALVAAPFLGIAFVFDFLLRAKDFPELASAMWGVFGLFVGLFFFGLSLFLSAACVSIFGTAESGIDKSKWRNSLEVWVFRLLATLSVVSLCIIGFWMLNTSAYGFRTFVAPYVEWLKLHSGQG